MLIKRKEYIYEFNAKWLLLQFGNYLDSSYGFDSLAPFVKKKDFTYYYGMHCYVLLSIHIEKLISDGNYRINWRLFTLLYDHKLVMYDRISYLMNNRYICHDEPTLQLFYRLLEDAKVMRNLYLKYIITRDTNILRKILTCIFEMQQFERGLLEQICPLLA